MAVPFADELSLETRAFIAASTRRASARRRFVASGAFRAKVGGGANSAAKTSMADGRLGWKSGLKWRRAPMAR
jgi:hypothetical protein